MQLIPLSDVPQVVQQLLRTATTSILVRSNAHLQYASFVDMLDSTDCGRAVEVSIVLGIKENEGALDAQCLHTVLNTKNYLSSHSGKLRFSLEWFGCHGIIVDNQYGLFYRNSFMCNVPEVLLLDRKDNLEEYIELFQDHWQSPLNLEVTNKPLYEIKNSSDSRIQVISEHRWNNIIQNLASCPEQLHLVPPRDFEELIAELLSREGMEVQLTPKTRDGGRDILAWQSHPFGKFLYLVECKRYSPARPIGVGLVRQLYGVVEAEKVNGGILVATTNFTRDASNFASATMSRLKLADYNTLVSWIENTRDA